MIDPKELKSDLAHCTGTTCYFRSPIFGPKSLRYTEGIQYLAQSTECYWLLDEIIARNLDNAAVMAEEFQSWTLTRTKDTESQFDLICDDGNGNKVYTIHIDTSDFRLDEIKFFVSNGVLMLTSEW